MKKYLSLALSLAFISFNSYAEENNSSGKIFGKLPNGKEAYLFTLKNTKNIEVKITNYGGIVTNIIIPDNKGKFSDIALGYGSFEGYLNNDPHFGGIIGRYGNRISNGKFSINGKIYKLAVNNGKNHLHGGITGFDKVLWDARQFENKEGKVLELNYLSKDGEEGYPGNLNVIVKYVLTEKNELKIYYSARTDKDTVLNLTHHSYFNLSAEEDILSHKLKINADKFTPVNENMIPTGKVENVGKTPFDFRKITEIGKRINDNNIQLKYGNGYDHNYVLNGKPDELKFAAEVIEEKSGRIMKVYTTEPGIQFYTGNFLDSSIKAKNNQVYKKRSGFCLETQHFPDSPNIPSFPSTLLKPGKEYKQLTIYEFGLK